MVIAGKSPYDIMAQELDCGLKVSKFKLQSCYYIHFWTSTIGKGMTLLIPLAIGLNSITAVLLQG